MLNRIRNKKITGEGHIMSVILVMAVVTVLCVYFRTQIAQWFTTIMAAFNNDTVKIFNNM